MDGDRERKEDQILRLYYQRRIVLGGEQDNNECNIRKQDEKIEKIVNLDYQIRNLIGDINADIDEKDLQFMSYFEENYSENYRREINQANEEKEDLMREKRRLYDLEDEYERERNVELKKLEDEV